MTNIRTAGLLLSILLCATSYAQNIALGKATVASSLENSGQFPASAVTDGYGTSGQINSAGSCIAGTCTRWSSTFSDPQWIYIDLGNLYSLSSVVLYWEQARAASFQIQVSNDANNWTTVQTITNNNSSSNTISMGGASGRYVRMFGTSRATQYGYSLWEFEVYGTAIILPIRLTNFSAGMSREGALLNWKAILDRTSTFEVQRSEDGSRFYPIDTLVFTPATANNLVSGVYIDKQPVIGKNYYRLKYWENGVDRTYYSDVAIVNNVSASAISVYPNPVKGSTVQVTLPQAYSSKIEVRLLNTMGAVVSKQTIQLNNSKQFQAAIKPGLQTGTYWLSLNSNQLSSRLKVTIGQF